MKGACYGFCPIEIVRLDRTIFFYISGIELVGAYIVQNCSLSVLPTVL